MIENMFKEVTRRICGNLKIHEALYDVFLFLKDHLPISSILLTAYDIDNRAIRVIAGTHEMGGVLVNQSFPFPHEVGDAIKKWQNDSMEKSMTTPWIRNETHSINRLASELFYRMLPEGFMKWDGKYSTMTCALKIQNEIIGNLTFISLDSVEYNLYHANIIKEINEPFAIALSNSLHIMELERNNQELKEESRKVKGDVMIGVDGGLKDVKKLIEQVAPTLSHVLLQGETGSGKEVVANEIHKLSSRSNGPLVSLNCGAIPETLIDSELFGHEKGSFTGAFATRPGHFERAHKGTLFLDEVGELPMSAQTKLLRIIQTGELKRVGGTRNMKVDVRLICATHRDLLDMTKKGQFREDLWYRLNVFPIMIPPLRERICDIPAMINHFIQIKCQEMNISPPPELASGTLETLMAYHWPGNARELQNLIERALILSNGNPLSFPDLNPPTGLTSPSATADHDAFPRMDDVVAEHIKWALSKTDGKISGKNGAADLLGMHPNTLRSRMDKLSLVKSSQITRVIKN